MELDDSTIIINPGNQAINIGFSGNPTPKQFSSRVVRSPYSSPLSIPMKRRKLAGNSEADEDKMRRLRKFRTELIKRKHLIPPSKGIKSRLKQQEEITAAERFPRFSGTWFDESNCKEEIKLKASRIDTHSTPNGVVYNVSSSAPLDPSDMAYSPFQFGMICDREGEPNFQKVSEDVEQMFKSAIEGELEVPLEECKSKSAVLVISDAAPGSDICNLCDVLLNKIGFESISIVRESVAASFASGHSTCCVVNIGASHSTVSCVVNGRIAKGASEYLAYSTREMTQFYHWLMCNSSYHHYPLEDYDSENREMLDSVWHALKGKWRTSQDVVSPHFNPVASAYCTIPSSDSLSKQGTKYSFNTSDELTLAPNAFFSPDLFDSIDSQTSLPLDECIVQCIQSIENNTIQQELMNHVLLIGGGASIRGLASVLQDRLISKIRNVKSLPNAVVTRGRLIFTDHGKLSFVGGSLVAQSKHAFQITKTAWNSAHCKEVFLRKNCGFSISDEHGILESMLDDEDTGLGF